MDEIKESNITITNLPTNPILCMEDSSDDSDQHHWSKDCETQLTFIEQNSAQQANISKKEYLDLLVLQKYFKLPVIILSGLNSIFAIGMVSFMSQNIVSILNCILGFICATIGSIELYLNITKRLEISYQSYQNFYLLSIKINNTLRLERSHRDELDGRAFLKECLNTYEQLFQANNITKSNIDDKLISKEII